MRSTVNNCYLIDTLSFKTSAMKDGIVTLGQAAEGITFAGTIKALPKVYKADVVHYVGRVRESGTARAVFHTDFSDSLRLGDKVYFLPDAIDEFSFVSKELFSVPLDRIIAYERDGNLHAAGGHMLLYPVFPGGSYYNQEIKAIIMPAEDGLFVPASPVAGHGAVWDAGKPIRGLINTAPQPGQVVAYQPNSVYKITNDVTRLPLVAVSYLFALGVYQSSDYYSVPFCEISHRGLKRTRLAA